MQYGKRNQADFNENLLLGVIDYSFQLELKTAAVSVLSACTRSSQISNYILIAFQLNFFNVTTLS